LSLHNQYKGWLAESQGDICKKIEMTARSYPGTDRV
jgi:hypothetical protein